MHILHIMYIIVIYEDFAGAFMFYVMFEIASRNFTKATQRLIKLL